MNRKLETNRKLESTLAVLAGDKAAVSILYRLR